MTIEVDIQSVPDIALDNDLISWPDFPYGLGEKISAASFLIKGATHQCLMGVLGFIKELVDEKLPSHDLWLLLGNSVWQPNTRVVRYLKLWGALKGRGVRVSGGTKPLELLVEADGKLKFFGALCIAEASNEDVITAMVEERCSYIVALPKIFDFPYALKMGWSGDIRKDVALLNYVCGKNGLFFKRVGEFDDLDRGFVCLGRSSVISKFI